MAHPRSYREVDLSRLCEAIKRSRQEMEYYRTERLNAVRTMAGTHWSESGAGKNQPVNLLDQFVRVVGRGLIGKEPQVRLSTFDPEHWPAVDAMESWANRRITSMGLDEELKRCVVDALFCVGIMKIALASPSDASAASWNLRAGTPFAKCVDLDDFVYDITARKFSECAYLGHRYRVPLSSVKDSAVYHKSRRKLEGSEDRIYNEEGDERISALGRNLTTVQEEAEDMIDLWEIYIPRLRLVITLQSDDGGNPLFDEGMEPLRVQEWIGPDVGPYHFLAFGLIPGNAMPKGPVMDLIDLHEAANEAFRKLHRQAKRSKNYTKVDKSNTEDGERVRDANDGDIVPMTSPQSVEEVQGHGPNPAVASWFGIVKDLFNWKSGNIDALAGTNKQSDTATQDKLLHGSASSGVADMQAETMKFVSRVSRALCWFWWNDPFKVMKTTYEMPGLPGLSLPRSLHPKGAMGPNGQPPPLRRQAPFSEIGLKVDPYSLKHQSPEEMAATLDQVVMQIFLPAMALFREQGIEFDLNAYLAEMAKLKDMPVLKQIARYQEPPVEESEGMRKGDEGARMPGQTERKYVRENVSSRTDKDQFRALTEAMAGTDSGGDPNGGR